MHALHHMYAAPLEARGVLDALGIKPRMLGIKPRSSVRTISALSH